MLMVMLFQAHATNGYVQNVVGAGVCSYGSITYCSVKRKQIKTMLIQKCCVILSSAPKLSSLGESSLRYWK